MTWFYPEITLKSKNNPFGNLIRHTVLDFNWCMNKDGI